MARITTTRGRYRTPSPHGRRTSAAKRLRLRGALRSDRVDRVEHRKQKQLLGGTASEKLKLREPQTTNTRYSSTSTQRAVRRELIKMLEKTSARSSVTLYESMEVLGKLVRADIRKASDTLREQGHKSVALALEMVAERVSNRIEPRDARDILAAAIQVVRAVD